MITVEDLIDNSQVSGTASGQTKLYTLKEMLAPQPSQEWIIENLLSPGSVAIFSGAPGSKKTWVLLTIAACVAAGIPWLGRKVKQTPVIFVDEESGRYRLFDRMGKVTRGLGVSDDVPIYSTVMAGFNLAEDTSQLQDLILQTKAGLVIIDALADVAIGADENSAKDMMPLMANLRRLAETTQSAIILIHHDTKSKNSAYRGSSAIAGAVALLVSVVSAPKEGLVKFEIVKSWDVEPQTFYGVAEWDAFSDTFTLRETANTKMPKFTPVENYVITYLGDNGQATVDEIEANAVGCSPSSARKALYVLLQGGWVEKANTSGGGRGNKAVYCLSREGQDVYSKTVT